MFEYFPFNNVDDVNLAKEISCAAHKLNINNKLSDVGLREYISNLRKDNIFKSLHSNYSSVDQFNLSFKQNDSFELSVLHLNIRSLNSKVREFCTFIDLISMSFDIIILSEVWSTNVEFYSNILKTVGHSTAYCMYYDLPSDSVAGGVCMFINKSLSVRDRKDLRLLSDSNCKTENLWFEVTKYKSKFVIGGIYRHPNQNIDIFANKLEITLNKICCEKLPCIIAGDINIDLLKYNNNKSTSDYLNNLLTHNFTPMLLLPTRITEYTSTLIDHIYFNENCASSGKFTTNSGNLYYELSDHLPNFIILSNSSKKLRHCGFVSMPWA